MITNRLTATGDWTFASTVRNSAAIRQNVVTRLRSVAEDWMADMDAGVPWFDILEQRGNEARILREVERVVLTTGGVRAIERLRVVSVDGQRAAHIELSFVDIFDQRYNDTVALP